MAVRRAAIGCQSSKTSFLVAAFLSVAALVVEKAAIER
jgi:hypothetical protein